MATYKDIKYNLGPLPNGVGEILIKSITVSSDSTISFTSGIDSTYKKYIFRFQIHVANDEDNLLWQASTNSGGAYGISTTNTYFRGRHEEDDGSAVFDINANADLSSSTNGISLGRSIGNDNDQVINGYICLYDPSNSSQIKHYSTVCSLSTGGSDNPAYNTYCGGYLNTTSAVDAVRFTMTNGNLDSGIIQLYGVK